MNWYALILLQRVLSLKYLVVYLSLFFINLTAISQTSDSQGLIEALKTQIDRSDGAEKLRLMDSLAAVSFRNENPEFEKIARESIDFAVTIDSTRFAMQKAINLIDFIAYQTARPEEASDFFVALESKVRKNAAPGLMGEFYWEGAGTFMMATKFREALKYLDIARGYAEQSGDSYLLAQVKRNTGHSYSMVGEFEKAVEEIQQAIDLYGDEHPISGAYATRSLAILFSQNGLRNEARTTRITAAQQMKNHPAYSGKDSISAYNLVYTLYFDQAFDEAVHNNPKDRLRFMDSAAVYVDYLYSEYDDFQLLISLLGTYAQNGLTQQATAVKEEIEKKDTEAMAVNMPEYNLSMGEYEFLIGNISKAATYGHKEYEFLEGSQFYEGLYLVNKFLAKVYNRAGNNDLAYKYLSRYSAIKDSIESVQKSNGFAYYQTLLETERKETRIAVQNSRIEVLDAQNNAKTRTIYFGGLAVLAVIALIILSYYARFNRKRQKLQTAFSQELIREREKQYAHIARELHDSVGQKLMLLTKKTQLHNSELNDLAKDSLQEIRTISHGLHPDSLKHTGISSAITSMINKTDDNTEIFFTHQIENIDGLLNDEKELHLYRILQESLNNLVKHSNAKSASIDIEKQQDSIKAVVSDNGSGFSIRKVINKGSLGLKTLLERAEIIDSKLDIVTQENEGTKITLLVPFG